MYLFGNTCTQQPADKTALKEGVVFVTCDDIVRITVPELLAILATRAIVYVRLRTNLLCNQWLPQDHVLFFFWSWLFYRTVIGNFSNTFICLCHGQYYSFPSNASGCLYHGEFIVQSMATPATLALFTSWTMILLAKQYVVVCGIINSSCSQWLV